MNAFLLLLALPFLVVADTQCPDSNISCPDDKRCCEVDGQQTCCDIDDNIDDVHNREGKMKVYAGEAPLEQTEHYSNSSITIQYALFGKCNFLNCQKGKCCKDFCCPYGSRSVCCPEPNRCCLPELRCCAVGCCPKRQECCASGCCPENQRCCGSWCCKKKAQCGAAYNTCYGKGVSFTPAIATVLLLAATAVISRHL